MCIIFRAFLKLASSRQSFSKTPGNNFQNIGQPRQILNRHQDDKIPLKTGYNTVFV